jgi:predicted amidohydrolase
MPERSYAARDELVLRMRAEGASFIAIAAATGVKRSSAWRYYQRAVARRDRRPYVPGSTVGTDPGLEGPNFAAWAAGFFDGEGCIHANIDSAQRAEGRTRRHPLAGHA